jgi:hypothetical protein
MPWTSGSGPGAVSVKNPSNPNHISISLWGFFLACGGRGGARPPSPPMPPVPPLRLGSTAAPRPFLTHLDFVGAPADSLNLAEQQVGELVATWRAMYAHSIPRLRGSRRDVGRCGRMVTNPAPTGGSPAARDEDPATSLRAAPNASRATWIRVRFGGRLRQEVSRC